MGAPVPSTLSDPFDFADARELQHETVQLAIGAVVGLAIGVLGLGAFVLNRVGTEIFATAVGFALVAGIARVAARHSTRIASVSLVGSLAAVFAFALLVFPAYLIAPWISVLIVLASAIWGWPWAGVTAFLASGTLLIAAHDRLIDLPTDIAVSAILLAWACLFVSWMTARPTQTALAWAATSYRQTLTLIDEARERQAQLARVTKSLGESYYRLEQLNLDLERARRAAQEARRLKAQFAAAVSHELRTPLNLIIGFCEMMVLSPATAYGQRLPSSYRDDLEAIYRNACHISALVDDILDLSQIDADRMALHREWTTLDQIVEEAIAPVATLFRDRGLYLNTAIAHELPPLLVDRTRIRQILINLLNNAARVTDEGGVTLRAWQECQSIVVAVEDTGPGIPPEERTYLFEEFSQVGEISRRRGGSGLGLAVSKRFAELHQGTLWVESTVGQGSTFFLRLPVGDDVPPAAANGWSWDDRMTARVHGQPERRILVVDRSEEVQRVFRRYLDGYRVVDLAEVRQSLESGAREPLCAVLIGSPGGRAQWDSLARLSPDWQRLPVIYCPIQTGRQVAEQLAVSDYLIKPVSRDQLRSALRRLDLKLSALRTVLIADDDPEMQRLLSRMIRSITRRCRIFTASDGDHALALMREHAPDVVLLDLLMPSLDGLGVLEAIREDANLRGTPVLIITARGHSETIVANEMRVVREGGLSVAEVMRWLKSGLDALLAPGTIVPTSPAAPPE